MPASARSVDGKSAWYHQDIVDRERTGGITMKRSICWFLIMALMAMSVSFASAEDYAVFNED